jgi:hypothetical protein
MCCSSTHAMPLLAGNSRSSAPKASGRGANPGYRGWFTGGPF